MQVKMIPKDELKEMHTGSLMSRRKSLLQCEESLELSDKPANYTAPINIIEFKNSPMWKQAYTELKQELDTRENWPSKKERKEKRQALAKNR